MEFDYNCGNLGQTRYQIAFVGTHAQSNLTQANSSTPKPASVLPAKLVLLA